MSSRAGRFCRKCGSPVGEGKRFCGACGVATRRTHPAASSSTAAPAPAALAGPKRRLPAWLLVAIGAAALLIVVLGTLSVVEFANGSSTEAAPQATSVAPPAANPQPSTSPMRASTAAAEVEPTPATAYSSTPTTEPSDPGLVVTSDQPQSMPPALQSFEAAPVMLSERYPVYDTGATCTGETGFASDAQRSPVTLLPQNMLDGDLSSSWRCTYRVPGEPTVWDASQGRAVGESVVFDLGSIKPVHYLGLVPGQVKFDPRAKSSTFDGVRYTENGRVVSVRWDLDDGLSYQQFIDLPSWPANNDPNSLPLSHWWAIANLGEDHMTRYVRMTIMDIAEGNNPTLAGSAKVAEVGMWGSS